MQRHVVGVVAEGVLQLLRDLVQGPVAHHHHDGDDGRQPRLPRDNEDPGKEHGEEEDLQGEELGEDERERDVRKLLGLAVAERSSGQLLVDPAEDRRGHVEVVVQRGHQLVDPHVDQLDAVPRRLEGLLLERRALAHHAGRKVPTLQAGQVRGVTSHGVLGERRSVDVGCVLGMDVPRPHWDELFVSRQLLFPEVFPGDDQVFPR
mmetsp:Transcript_4854/g.13226  ORF Transcript_4854/g.13226 Transcript_4854/m.13226 type:complete len:205 (+) Transcript_4854:545-1159(+)